MGKGRRAVLLTPFACEVAHHRWIFIMLFRQPEEILQLFKPKLYYVLMWVDLYLLSWTHTYKLGIQIIKLNMEALCP